MLVIGNGYRQYAALVLVSLCLATKNLEATRRKLIALDPPGSVDTRAFGISDSGDVVGLYFTPDNRVHGFLLSRGVYTSIDVYGSIRTNALGVTVLQSSSDDDRRVGSDGGLAVVGRYDTPDNVAHGYLLRDGALTTIDYPGTRFTVATGINSSGHIVGRYQGADGFFHAFTWIDGKFTTIEHPGRSIHAIGINSRGDMAGYYEDAEGTFHGFERIRGEFSTVDPPGSLATGGPGGIVGINSREMVGTYRLVPASLPCGCDGTIGFIFKHGDYTSYEFPGAIATSLTGINRRGDMVGIYHDEGGRRHGFVVLRGAED